MRIGIDCRSIQDPQFSGVPNYTRALLRELVQLPRAQQHEFILRCNGSFLQSVQNASDPLNIGVSGPHITWQIGTQSNKWFSAKQLVGHIRPGAIERFFDTPVDVAFVPNMHFFPIADTQTPTVLTVHDLSHERYPEFHTLKSSLKYRLLRSSQYVDAAAEVIAVSEATATDLQELYTVDPQRIHTVYPGIPEQVVLSTEERKSIAHSLNLPEKYIFCMSTIEPRKNIGALLHAAEELRYRLPEYQIIVAGAAGWKSRSEHRRMRNTRRVRYLGYISEQEKAAVMHYATAFVYPTLYEGFGFPPLEAQRAGIPVIAGAHSSLSEVLGSSALFVNPLDTADIGRAIVRLAESTELQERFIAAGRKNVQRFEWRPAAEMTLRILEQAGS